MSANTSCPRWCTTTHDHHLHEGLLFDLPGEVAVTVNCGEFTPLEVSLWDQGSNKSPVTLDAGQARTLARIVAQIESREDVARFTKALTEAAEIVQGATAHATEQEATS